MNKAQSSKLSPAFIDDILSTAKSQPAKSQPDLSNSGLHHSSISPDKPLELLSELNMISTSSFTSANTSIMDQSSPKRAEMNAKTLADLEQVTTAAIALEHYLNNNGGAKSSEVKQSIDQILNFCTQLSQTLPSITAANPSFLEDIRAVVAMLQIQWRHVRVPNVIFQMIADILRHILDADRTIVMQLGTGNEGKVVMESLGEGWTPTKDEVLPLSYLGITGKLADLEAAIATDKAEPITIISLHSNLSPYQHQLLEKFQVKSSVTYNLFLNDKLWGFIAVQSCQKERPWTVVELEWLRQLARELMLKLQPIELESQSQRQLEQANTINSLVERMLKEPNVNRIYETTVREIRRYLAADRVAVFQFEPGCSYDDGVFIAEDVALGYPSAIAAKVHDHCFGNQFADKYRDGAIQAVADIHDANLSDCHINILEQFEIRANLIVPLLKDNELWGLLCVHQCRGPREWTDTNIRFLKQVAAQFSIVRQKAEYTADIEHSASRERTISQLSDRILKSANSKEIYSITVREVRRFLQADRVGVFQFYPDSGYDDGEFIAEDVQPGIPSAMAAKIHDHCFGNQFADKYRDGAIQAVADIHNAGLSDCHIDILSQFEIRANLVVPLLNGSKLWGLLGVHQCRGPRLWSEEDIQFVKQIASQFSIARQQAEYVAEIRSNADRATKLAAASESGLHLINRLGSRIVDLARVGTSLNRVLELACRELRQQLKADRVAVFKFKQDWDGEFISEDSQGIWMPLVENQSGAILDHTTLRDTQGSRLQNGESLRVNDIYNGEHADYHIAFLEQFEIKAYMVAPIFEDNKLWGLLGIYQTTGTRHWQDLEEVLSTQVAAQIGLALEQAEAAQVLKRSAQRERMIRTIGEQISRVQNPVDFAQVASYELKQYLECDRVGVYQFNSDWSGEFIAETVGPEWVSVLELQRQVAKLRGNINRCTVQQLGAVAQDNVVRSAAPADTYLQQSQGGRYSRGELYRVTPDIYSEGFSPCYIEVLEYYQARAYVIVAIHVDGYLWGLLAVYQNDGPRVWQQNEIDIVVQIAQQLGLAVQQTNYVAQLQATTEQLQTLAEQEKADKEQLQQQIIQMLSAVRPALDGDLTVQVPVTEDAVGTVASAYNNTIDSLRELVTQVKEAATQVQTTSRTSESAVRQLSGQTQKELDDIQRVLKTIQSMVNASRVVAGSAQQMEQAVSQANQTVQEGDRAMNRTVESILAIRETVSATTKKIKRLGESSQKISKVVSLINNFTTQTNLLALNAAIEATRAGEYGQGFAVVADEVRSLSQQSAEATAEIEALVSEIQEETGSVSQAMDEGIQQVVQGTNLVSETRQSLNAIVQATSQISLLVKGISQAAQTQTQQSDSAIHDMDELSTTAQQTFGKAEEMAIAFQTLLATSETLQSSINQFKIE